MYEWDLFDDDDDLIKSHEHRFFMFTGSDNGEESAEPVYGEGFTGYYRTDGFTYKVGHGYYFYGRPVVIGMDFDYYKTFMEFEKTQKRFGSGFTDTWRVIEKYDIDMYGGETETATDTSEEVVVETEVSFKYCCTD